MAQSSRLKNSSGLKNYKVKNNNSGRFKHLVQKIGNSRKNQIITFVAAFAVIGGGVLLAQDYAAGVYPTGANDIVIQKVTRGAVAYIKGSASPVRPDYDFRLYGDGRLLCTQLDGSVKEATLSSDEVYNAFIQIHDAGLTTSQNLMSSTGGHVRRTIIDLNTDGGANRLVYDNSSTDNLPAVVTNVNKVLGQVCADAQLSTTPITSPLTPVVPPTTQPAPIKKNALNRIFNQKPTKKATRSQVRSTNAVRTIAPSQAPKPKDYRINRNKPLSMLLTNAFASIFNGLKHTFNHLAAASSVNWNDETDQYNRINQARSQNGAAALGRSDCLTKAARDWAVKQSQVNPNDISDPGLSQFAAYCPNFTNQNGPNHTTASNYVAAANTGIYGYCHPNDSQDNCSQMIFNDGKPGDGRSFMTSDGHRQNIFGPYNLVGTGAYRTDTGYLIVVHMFVACDSSCGSAYTAPPSPDPYNNEAGSGSNQPTSSNPSPTPTPSPAPATAPAPCSTAPSGSVPVHRLYRPNGDHYWTTSQAEVNSLVNPTTGWQDIDIAYCAYNSQVSGTIPVYHVYDPARDKHYWTTSLDEANGPARQSGFTYQGVTPPVAFFVPASSSFPVYHLYNYSTGLHYWTASLEEANGPAAQSGYSLVNNGSPAWYASGR